MKFPETWLPFWDCEVKAAHWGGWHLEYLFQISCCYHPALLKTAFSVLWTSVCCEQCYLGFLFNVPLNKIVNCSWNIKENVWRLVSVCPLPSQRAAIWLQSASFTQMIVQEASVALEITVERKDFRTMILSFSMSLSSYICRLRLL